jgi:hypothetical protein
MPFDGTPQDPKEVEVKMVLSRAIELVEQGWCKRRRAGGLKFLLTQDIRYGKRRFCASGALDRAAFELGVSRYEASWLLRSVALEQGHPTIETWNDNCSSSAIVLAGMRLAMA